MQFDEGQIELNAAFAKNAVTLKRLISVGVVPSLMTVTGWEKIACDKRYSVIPKQINLIAANGLETPTYGILKKK